jgi:SulP family sulfate permease
VIGFTNGIAVLIALSQVKDFLGLAVHDMPADFFGILHTLAQQLHTTNPWALGVAAVSLALIVLWPLTLRVLARRTPWLARWNALPGAMVALVASTLAVALFHLPVDTIGSAFGGIPSGLPAFGLPHVPWESARLLLMPAITLALLGAIESLLCARVADGMTHDRHDPNQELMAQGIANVAAPLLGGMPATGTIARTVTNVKSGATSPIAGVVHALVLLVVVLVAAPLASSIPLACLAAILMHVAWKMGDWRAFARLRQFRFTYRGTLLAVFLLTVIFDLTVAVQVGILAACGVFIFRMSGLARAERLEPEEFAGREADIRVWRLSGALFFGSTTVLEALQDTLPARVLVLDFAPVIYLDTSAVATLKDLQSACREQRVTLLWSGFTAQPLDLARRSGLLDDPVAELHPDLPAALAAARTRLARAPE